MLAESSKHSWCTLLRPGSQTKLPSGLHWPPAGQGTQAGCQGSRLSVTVTWARCVAEEAAAAAPASGARGGRTRSARAQASPRSLRPPPARSRCRRTAGRPEASTGRTAAAATRPARTAASRKRGPSHSPRRLRQLKSPLCEAIAEEDEADDTLRCGGSALILNAPPPPPPPLRRCVSDEKAESEAQAAAAGASCTSLNPSIVQQRTASRILQVHC